MDPTHLVRSESSAGKAEIPADGDIMRSINSFVSRFVTLAIVEAEASKERGDVLAFEATMATEGMLVDIIIGAN